MENSNQESIIIRAIQSKTRGNKNYIVDYICSEHNMEISILAQWIIFGGVKMDFSTFIINIII